MQPDAPRHALNRPPSLVLGLALTLLAMIIALVPAVPANADELPHDFDIENACQPGEAPRTSFRDIGPPHDQAIRCLAWYGITQGRTSTFYGTNEDVTRAQTATFIVRLLNEVEGLQLPSRDRGAFRDVDGTGPHGANIEVLANVDPPILEGFEDGTFRPGSAIKRDQFASVIDRMIEYVAREVAEVDDLPAGRATFSDVGDESPHSRAISRLADARVILGREDGTYRPRWDVNRGQAATFVARVLGSFVYIGVVDRPADAPAANLAGIVHDAENAQPGETGDPIDTTVEIRGDAARALETGSDGRYAVQLPPGEYELTVEADGYVPFRQWVEVADGDSATLDFPMYRSAQVPEESETSQATGLHVDDTRDNFWVIPLIIDGQQIDVQGAEQIVLHRADGVVLRLGAAGTSESWWSRNEDGTSGRTGAQTGDHVLYYEFRNHDVVDDGWYDLTARFDSEGRLTHVNDTPYPPAS